MAGRKSKFAELRIFELENLTVNGAIEILNGDDEKRKFALIKDLAGKVLARRIKVGGDKDNPIAIQIYLPAKKAINGENGMATASGPRTILPVSGV